ncbi:MAG: hypothetical protein PHE25_03650 [Candidatus Gracilibacteria bacterium]|nr:hypothetical protein [Candidatus Gracilibacteria bacterium]
MNYKQKLTIIFFITIFCLSFYISGIYAIPSLVFSLFFYSILTYILYGMYKKLIDKSYLFFSVENYKTFLNIFLYKVSSLMMALIIIIGGFSYYENEITPAKIPTFTISNGDKTIVFQAMSHIGTPNFYEKIKENIIKLKKDSYVLYFEGVRPGTKENQESFNKALGVKLDSKTYENMSKLYGLINQDNHLFLGLVNDKDYNVDVSIDDIIGEYNKIINQVEV